MIKQIGKYEFPQNIRKFKQLKRDIPELIATNSVNHFQEGFRKGGYQTDESSDGWRKRQSGGRRRSRAILVDRGILWRDIKAKVKKWDNIVIGTSNLTIDYAEVHNRGIGRMPQREFIGDSKKLTESNKKLIEKHMDKVMNV